MDIGNKYSFHFEEARHVDHDYFLQDFTPLEGENYYCARLLKTEAVRAEIYMQVRDDGLAYSLKGAPFGGFWINGKMNSEGFQFFLKALKEAMRSLKVNALQVNQAPGPYSKDAALIHYMLKTQGFQLENLLLHHFMDGKKYIKNYLQEKLPKWQKKTKKHELHLEVGPIKTFNFLKDIKMWRGQRGHAYNVNEEKLIRQVSAYPERYHLVSVFYRAEPVAHVLCVQLTSNSLYYYLPAINPGGYPTYTGEAALVAVVRLGDSLGVDFIDLGSSDLDGAANHSLMHFKSKHANLTDNKLTWKIHF